MFKKFTLTTLLVSLVFCIFARDFKADALSYLKQNKKQFTLSDQDITELKMTDQYTDEDAITHIWFQQTAYGVALYNSSIAVHLNNKGEVAYSTGEGVLDLRTKINTSSSSVSVTKAIGIASRLTAQREPVGVQQIGKLPDGRLIFDKIEGVTNDPVYVRQVYFQGDDNKIKLGWEVTIDIPSHEHSWSFHLDATTGALIKQIDNVVHEMRPNTTKFLVGNNNTSTGTANKNNNTGSSTGNLLGNTSTGQSALSVPETSTYRVYPYYTEAPTFGPRVLIANPPDSLPSPFGWNDTNGAAGAEGTLTTGNNVDAYTDKDGNDVADANSRPNATASLAFDFPLDLTQRTDTLANIKAAVAQLYYMNNIMHDITYKYGFTEVAGNYQKNNYSRGGTQNDFVKAEALDGSGTNNANFQAGADGTSGRMQMYMWPVLTRPILYINAPASIKDTITETARADFGPCSFNVTGTCVIANDGTAHPTYACNAIVNFAAMNGKIAIVDRNDCNFYDKVLNCQDAGAIGVIVVNRVDSLLGGMALPAGFDANAITIPSLFVLKSVGDALKANIATLNVTLFNDPANCNIPAYNGVFDNAVVAHEYSHGISGRLTGGPTNPNCLSNNEQMGEGWSDFIALALTHKPADTRTTQRGIGTYVVGEAPTDPGIRSYPYTTDMAVNPITYATLPTLPCQTDILGNCIANSAEVHDQGEVWTEMLWEMYWNLIDKYGYSSNVYSGTAGAATTTAGNLRAIKLVIAGLTYQPCSPGFVDGRNAILKADSILYAKADYCEIWRAFAKRGLGAGAKQGSSANSDDGTAAYDLPASCSGATAAFTASDTTVCAGGTLTFTNTSTGSPDSVRWTIPGGVPSTSTSITTVTPVFSTPGTYVISLIAYKTGNASVAATKSIRVKAHPTVGVNSPTICSGQTASLTATGATTYTWTGGLAATATVTTPALTSMTTYTVTGTTSGCTGTAVATVTVNPNPTVGVNSPTICSGTTASLTATGATTYTWTGGLAATATVTTPTLTSTTTYTVTGTTSGCTATAVATVTVTPLPNVAVNSPSICSGNTASLTATGATGYTWTGGLASTATVTTPTLTSTTTYTVTGTTGSCSKTAVATVTVTPQPTVNVNSPTICSGNTASLTATGATSYT
ncbi:MAG: putative metalloprotease, partial [Bacteroidota bacterium]|nr:putative metalloprotease [Bacteroidota bacterium]